MSGRALQLIQNSGGRYIGNTTLTPGQEQQQLTNYTKNETGGNPQMNDRVGDIATGIIWTFNGTKWIQGVVDPNAQQIQKNKNDIANLTKRVTKNEEDIVDLKDDLAQEKVDRQNKDDDLQDQIDALQALAKGVKEVVGTYADMEALDKTLLVDGDIINVLADETHDGINAYYRFDHATQTYTYIGSISPYYTKIEIDNKENKLKEEIAKKQNKLIAGDGIELTDNGDDTVTIKAKLEGLQSDTPLENGDKYFTDGGAYKLAPTLNGQKVLENPTFYAPETIGTEGQIITVDAAGKLAWVDNVGSGTIDGLEINGVAQPVTPDTKIIQINTDDSLTENVDTNTFYVSKANVPITKDDYANLTQVQKEDETKVYLITDDTTDVPVVISNINDEDITSQSEDFTRSNKYLTEKFDNLKITLNDAETVVNPNLKIYAPTETYIAGSVPVLGQDNVPRFSLDYLSGLKVNNIPHNGANDVPEIYVPTEAGTDGKAVLWSDADNKPVWGDNMPKKLGYFYDDPVKPNWNNIWYYLDEGEAGIFRVNHQNQAFRRERGFSLDIRWGAESTTTDIWNFAEGKIRYIGNPMYSVEDYNHGAVTISAGIPDFTDTHTNFLCDIYCRNGHVYLSFDMVCLQYSGYSLASLDAIGFWKWVCLSADDNNIIPEKYRPKQTVYGSFCHGDLKVETDGKIYARYFNFQDGKDKLSDFNSWYFCANISYPCY